MKNKQQEDNLVLALFFLLIIALVVISYFRHEYSHARVKIEHLNDSITGLHDDLRMEKLHKLHSNSEYQTRLINAEIRVRELDQQLRKLSFEKDLVSSFEELMLQEQARVKLKADILRITDTYYPQPTP